MWNLCWVWIWITLSISSTWYNWKCVNWTLRIQKQPLTLCFTHESYMNTIWEIILQWKCSLEHDPRARIVGLTGRTPIKRMSSHDAFLERHLSEGCPRNWLHVTARDIPSSLQYKTHLSMQLNCSLLRCSWSIACRRCSNYIFILHLTLGLNILLKDNCMPRRGTFMFWELVRLISMILRYIGVEDPHFGSWCLLRYSIVQVIFIPYWT